MHAAGLGWIRAATIAAAIWPPLLLAGLLLALFWAAAGFVPDGWRRFTAVMTLFVTPMLYQFMPGHVDHHGLMTLIAVIAFGCAVRMMENPQKPVWAAGLGFSLALGLAIALEILPWLLLLSGWTVLWMAAKGRTAARSGLAFGLTLFAASAAFLILLQPPSMWLKAGLAAYSLAYVAMAGGIAFVCTGEALASQLQSKFRRFMAGGGCALAAAAGLLAAFPQFIGGPWTAVNKDVADLLLDNVNEATPLIKTAGTSFISAAVFLMLPPALALAAAIRFRRQASREKAWKWTLAIVLIAAGMALSLFYQVRFVPYAEAFGIMPLTALAEDGLPHLAHRGFRFAAMKSGLVLLALFALILLPVQFLALGINRKRTHAAAEILDAQYDRPRVILNTINDGAELLFRTPHAVISAPYHTDVGGILDDSRFFLTSRPDEAEAIARAYRADLVLMDYAMYAGIDKPAPDGAPCALGPAADFAKQLACGRIPPWLQPVKLPLPPGYFLFEVKPESDRTRND
jgi:hypothetical protein